MIKSPLFTPCRIGRTVVKNRIMRSACWEKMADANGNPSHELLRSMVKLARGGCGIIVPGFVYPQITAKANYFQTGMCTSKHAQPWKKPIKEIHTYGAKIIFQVCHGGVASPPDLIFDTPRGASATSQGTREMTIPEIEDTIQAFMNAAMLVEKIGGDGIQIHAAHGYLLSAFLSPAANKRTDKYGGSKENRLRIVQEIIREVRMVTSPKFIVAIKMNGNDCIDGGVTPELCAQYVNDLKKDIDLFEISCGFCTALNIIRSKVNHKTLFQDVTQEQRELINTTLSRANPQFPYSEGYNVDACKYIKSKVPGAILAAVGGNRNMKSMESIINNNYAEIVSLGRPFLREPNLTNNLQSGNKQVQCISCGECILKKYREGPIKCVFPK